jgi:ABC-type transport system substrate-binding protein
MIGRRRAKTCLSYLLGAAAALLAGCTNNPYPDADAQAKVLYLAFSQPPKTLDPQVAYTVIDHSVLGNVFDSLLEYAYLERPYRLIPGLAEAVPEPEVRADGHVVYRFTLRPDLRFQSDPAFGLDGSGRTTRTVSAADVAFSLQRIGDPAVGSPVVDTFAKTHDLQAFGERLAQARKTDPAFAALAVHEQYARVGGIAGVRALDERTLEVELSAAYPQILYWFAMPFTAPVPWEAVATYDGEDGRDNLADHPVGTGPFRLDRYDRLSRIVLARNDDWYGVRHPEWHAPGAVYPSQGAGEDAAEGLLAAAGKPLPFLDRIEFRRDPESVPAFIKFMQGYYDTSPIIRESFDRLVRKGVLSPDAAARGMELEKSVTAGVYYLGFNMDDPVLGSAAGEPAAALRQAMSLAIDSEEFLRLFTNGRGLPAQSPLPPGIFGYDPAYKNPWRQPDRARAAERLAAAGYPNGIDPATGKPLHLTFDVYDTSARGLLMFQFLADAWKRIGLDVEIAASDYNQFQDKVRRGAYQIFYWGWVADYPDPENFLFLLYGPMSRTASGGPNTANFADAHYDELFTRMRTMPNDAERTALINEMLAVLERQTPWIPVFYPEDYALHHGWLHNVKPPAMSIQTYKYWDLDPPRRATERREWNVPIRWPAYVLLAGVVLGGVFHRFSPQRHSGTEKK